MHRQSADRWAAPQGILPVLLLALVGMSLNAPLAAGQGASGPATANKEIARRFLLAIQTKDAAAMRAVLTPTARLIFMIAGVYSPELRAFPQGTQWDRDGLINMEVNFQKGLEAPSALQIVSMITEGELVAAEVVGRGVRASTGRPYVQHYSYHFQISAGRITDIRLYQDTFELWDVWNNPGPPAQPPYHLTSEAAIMKEQHVSPSLHGGDSEDRIAMNKESVRRFLMAVQAHDANTVRAVWAPDGVWSFAVGGDYSPALHAFQGAPRWDREAMIGMQENSQRSLKEPLTIDIYSLIGEGDEVSAEAVGFLVRPSGRAYRQHYSLHFKALGGKLVEGHVYQDTLHQYDLGRDHGSGTPAAGLIPP